MVKAWWPQNGISSLVYFLIFFISLFSCKNKVEKLTDGNDFLAWQLLNEDFTKGISIDKSKNRIFYIFYIRGKIKGYKKINENELEEICDFDGFPLDTWKYLNENSIRFKGEEYKVDFNLDTLVLSKKDHKIRLFKTCDFTPEGKLIFKSPCYF